MYNLVNKPHKMFSKTCVHESDKYIVRSYNENLKQLSCFSYYHFIDKALLEIV